MYLEEQIWDTINGNCAEKLLNNFKIITNLRTTESGEDDLSIEWMKEETFLPSAGNALTDISLDQLERFSFAKKIANAIAKRKNSGSVVMGIYGLPGEGKTTVLNFLGYELAKFQHVTFLRINPSGSANSIRLVKNFFDGLSGAIENSEEISSSLRKKIILLLSRYSAFLAPSEDEAPGKKLRLFKKTPREIKETLDACFRKLERRIVFLVDDLDKTELNEVRTFLRLIKLSANFPNSVYVLSFDDNTLSLELGGMNKKQSLLMGRKILEKVVHLSLRIPPAGKYRLLEMCFKGISEILNEADLAPEIAGMREFKEKFSSAFTHVIKTPRQCSLYLNTISNSLTGQGTAGLDSLKFMLVEALRVFYPVLYDVIRNNPDTFIGIELNKSQTGEVEESISLFAVNKAMENLPDEEQKALKSLLSYLFPCLRGIPGFGTEEYTGQNPWIEEKPVASKQYFLRYFLLNTSGTDDFQRETDRLLLRSATGNINDQALAVRMLVRQAGADAFIAGVESRIEEMSPVASGNLIRALAQTGGSFLNPETLFSFTTVYAHPAMLIRKLLLNIPELSDRFSIAAFLMKESEPVSFAFECLRWIKPSEKEDRIFSPEVEEGLSAMLTERIKNLAYRYPIYLSMPQETPLLLSVWSFLGSREETTRYLESTFRKEPDNVVEFLRCYMPDEWMESKDNELNGSFLLNLNSSVSGVIEAKAVYKQLEKAAAGISGPAASKENSLRKRLLTELAPISGDNRAGNRNSQLKVFHINEYDKDNKKKISEADLLAGEIKRGNLTQVSKGLYRPLFDLFN